MSDTYSVNDIFYSLQGEGFYQGRPAHFIRLQGCNLKCVVLNAGFDCDTEFESGREMTAEEIIEALREQNSTCFFVVITGGEPALQIDTRLLSRLRTCGYYIAVETNGTIDLAMLRDLIDWITCSPKTAEHTLKLRTCDELKYVRAAHQDIPQPLIRAKTYYLMPASVGESIPRDNLKKCIDLAMANPMWRVTLQEHKLWSIR